MSDKEMKLSEQFALAIARLNRNEDGLIESEEWKRFFLQSQWSKWLNVVEEPCEFLGARKNKGRFALTFTDGSKVRMWQRIELEPIVDTPFEQILYRIVVEIMEDDNETE